MLASRPTLAALSAAMAPLAFAGVSTPHPDSVTLQALVTVGTTATCGMREAPHLIEHLLLSGTEYGESPVDAVLALRAKSIKLSAVTRSDFTLYTLEGPLDTAKLMEHAMVTFLGQSSLPTSGFEREKRVILHEVRAPESYVSSPTFYERFIAANAGGAKPCIADTSPFLSYRYDQVQSAYTRLYTVSTIKLIAQAPPHTFDLDAISTAIMGDRVLAPPIQPGTRELASEAEVLGSAGQVELIFPIEGRAGLPEDAANAYADQARLELQAHIRSKYQLYTTRSFVDQSLQGGWIRLEVPDIDRAHSLELVQVAASAMAKVDPRDYGTDPVWQALGANRARPPAGPPVVARLEESPLSLSDRIRRWLSGIKSGL